MINSCIIGKCYFFLQLSSNGNLQSLYPQTSRETRRGPLQYLREKLRALRTRNSHKDIDVDAIMDPEVTVTVTRDDVDAVSVSSNASKEKSDAVCLCQCECWFEPAGKTTYWWNFIVGLAVLYNYWVIIYRFAFDEIKHETLTKWFLLDYTADFIYILDVCKGFRTAFLEEGVLQTNTIKMRMHYMNSMLFYVDLLCLLPLDFLYLSINFNSLLRCFRFIKIYKLWKFIDMTERHTNYPNFVRTLTMLHYLLLIFHWNACLFFFIMKDSAAFDNIQITTGMSKIYHRDFNSRKVRV